MWVVKCFQAWLGVDSDSGMQPLVSPGELWSGHRALFDGLLAALGSPSPQLLEDLGDTLAMLFGALSSIATASESASDRRILFVAQRYGTLGVQPTCCMKLLPRGVCAHSFCNQITLSSRHIELNWHITHETTVVTGYYRVTRKRGYYIFRSSF